MIISLELGLPRASSDLPEDFGRASRSETVVSGVLLFGLAPGDACRAVCVTTDAVGSYPTISPLPEPMTRVRCVPCTSPRSAIGGVFSVAPVSDRSAWALPSALPVESGLSSRGESPAGDHPAFSSAPGEYTARPARVQAPASELTESARSVRVPRQHTPLAHIQERMVTSKDPTLSGARIGQDGSRIGIDESGKGDYFGPLVIAAVYVTPETEPDLALMEVRDSKRISDGRILELAPDIRLVCKHSIVAIGPERYNQLYEKIRNLNRLLAWGHARALENLLEQVDCELAIADQFGDERFITHALLEKGKRVRLVQMPKAEADRAVAAASILARAEFLIRLKRLSDEIGTSLPKGASQAVELAGRMVVKKHGRERLGTVAKLHFKTTKAVLAEG